MGVHISLFYFLMSSLVNSNILLQPHFLLHLSHANTWENVSCVKVQEIGEGVAQLPEVVS